MTTFVIGATGYVGTRVVSMLVIQKVDICCVKRDTSDISGLPVKDIQFVRNDETEIEKLFSQKHFDLVLNMACSYAQGTVLYNDVLEANIEFPLKVLNIAVKYGVKRFITIGTGLPDDFNMYSFSKHMLAEFGRFYHRKHGIDFCALELEMFYGPGEPRDRFIPMCIYKMYQGEPLLLTVGTQKRDLIYIDDVYNAIMFAVNGGVSGYQIIPVGTGDAPVIREIILYIHDLLHSQSELRFGAVPMRVDEPDCVADITLLSSLGFKARYHWKDGLKRMLEEEGLL